jgi:predicted MFS family arabinose efflux permease
VIRVKEIGAAIAWAVICVLIAWSIVAAVTAEDSSTVRLAAKVAAIVAGAAIGAPFGVYLLRHRNPR